jgi:hypothetical protein
MPLTPHRAAAATAQCVEGGKGVLAAAPAPSFQQRIADRLAPVPVDPKDRSAGAFMKRARNAALSGLSQDIHEVWLPDYALGAQARRRGARTAREMSRRGRTTQGISCMYQNSGTMSKSEPRLVSRA